jgi:fatty acid desaturase
MTGGTTDRKNGLGEITAQERRADELKALSWLRTEIQKEGLDKATPVLALSLLAFHLATMLAGITMFVMFDMMWVKALALVVSTYGALGIGMTGHNASHHAVTGSTTIDRRITFFTMTVLLGISANYWWHKHIRLHHTAPNHIGIDSDIDLLPFFALNQDEIREGRGWRRLHRVQHLIFPVFISLNMLNLKQTGVRYLIAELRRKKIRTKIWTDIACLCLHMVLFLIGPALFWPFWQVVGFCLLREIFNGYTMFMAVAPAHFPAEARFVKATAGKPGFLVGQIHTTVNYRTGFWGWLVCLGAEYQIEHHLLPTANPLKMRRISEIVEAFCRRHGYPYRRLGWREGIVKSLRAIADPKPVHHFGDLIGPPSPQ